MSAPFPLERARLRMDEYPIQKEVLSALFTDRNGERNTLLFFVELRTECPTQDRAALEEMLSTVLTGSPHVFRIAAHGFDEHDVAADERWFAFEFVHKTREEMLASIAEYHG